MKGTGGAVVAASMAAVASSAAVLSYSAPLPDPLSDPKCRSPVQGGDPGYHAGGHDQRSPAADRFAPRFDGLRFIETLITAHR